MGLLDIGAELINKLIPDPAARKEAQIKLMELEQKGELMEIEAKTQNIQAEAKSEHKMVAMARPMFMYVFYFIIICMGFIFPVLGIWFPDEISQVYMNMELGFKAIPGEMWATFSIGYVGYVGARTYDKKQVSDGKKTLMQKIFNK